MLRTFSQHQADGEKELSTEQQLAAKNHSEKVAFSLSQCIESNSQNFEDECSICLEIPKTNDIAITPCSHVFCRKCLLHSLKISGNRNNDKASKITENDCICPFCMTSIKTSQIKFTGSLSNFDDHTNNVAKKYDVALKARETLEAALNGHCSSKITAILKELDEIWKMQPGAKVIVFSQFLGMLDLIGKEIKKQGIISFRLDGKMSLKDRRSTLKEFGAHSENNDNLHVARDHSSNRGSVLLASMKACGNPVGFEYHIY